MRYSTKYYFTFNEFLNGEENWEEILNYTTESSSAVISKNLLVNYLIPRYGDGIVHISNTETPDYTALRNKIRAWLENTYYYYSVIINLYAEQEDNLFKGIKSTTTDNRALTLSGGNTNTLNAGEQKSVNRENSTPLNGGLYEDDEHTSSITQNKTDSYTNTYQFTYNNQKHQNSGTMETIIEPDTVVERLAEIRKKYLNVYTEWSESFRKFIYYPYEYEIKTPFGFMNED